MAKQITVQFLKDQAAAAKKTLFEQRARMAERLAGDTAFSYVIHQFASDVAEAEGMYELLAVAENLTVQEDKAADQLDHLVTWIRRGAMNKLMDNSRSTSPWNDGVEQGRRAAAASVIKMLDQDNLF